MRRGKMKVLHLIHRIDKPLLIHDIGIILLVCDRRCSHQLSVIRITRDTDEVILICLI